MLPDRSRGSQSRRHHCGWNILPATPEKHPPAGDVAPSTSDSRVDRLAEAARHAVLGRVLPSLRHDVAGAMQPVRTLLAVLERRVQNLEPDLAAITKNVISLSGLTKQAAEDCMNAVAWSDIAHDPCVNLRDSVDEAARLLALELSLNTLVLVNDVADGSATAPQSFFRGVFIGALLAFCDQHAAGGLLKVTFQEAGAEHPHAGQLHLRMLPSSAVEPPALPTAPRKPRQIGWPDVQAMADSGKVKMAQGDGWLTLDLPRRWNATG